MTIKEVGTERYDFIQSTVPSAEIGDMWLDTSNSPPIEKVFADLGSGGQFTVVSSNSTIQQNIDTTVSKIGPDLGFTGQLNVENTSNVPVAKYDISNKATSPTDITVSASGERIHVLDSNGDIYQWGLNSNFYVKNASFQHKDDLVKTLNNGSNLVSIDFKTDGGRLMLTDTSPASIESITVFVDGFDLNGPFGSNDRKVDISGKESAPTSAAFSDDGGLLYVTGIESNSIHEYQIDQNFIPDSLTGSSFNTSLDISGQTTNPASISLSADGLSMFIGDTSGQVFQYAFTQDFDLSNAEYTGFNVDLGAQLFEMSGVAISPDGNVLYAVGSGNDFVNQYFIGGVGQV